MRNCKGQNVIEYVLLVVAVLIVCIIFFSHNNGPMPQSLNTSLNGMVKHLDDLSGQIKF